MITLKTTTVDVLADTTVDVVTEHADLEAAHEAARAAVPAGWVLWDFAVSEDADDDECTALIVRG
jgi:hypothetical protein